MHIVSKKRTRCSDLGLASKTGMQVMGSLGADLSKFGSLKKLMRELQPRLNVEKVL